MIINAHVEFYLKIIALKFEKDELEKYSVKKGDLMVCEGGYPGRAAIWESIDTSFKSKKALHRIRFISKIESKLYLYFLN